MGDELNLFQNRELSHLEFHRRVLLKSIERQVPLFERLKFLQIFYNNVDEFYMTRVSALYGIKLVDKKKRDEITNLTSKQQLDLISNKVRGLLKLSEKVYFGLIKEAGKDYFDYVGFERLSKEELKYLEDFFDNNIFPLISPQIIDKHHPFPFLKNKEIYIFVRLFIRKKRGIKIGIIPVDGYFSRVVFIPSKLKNDDRKKFVLIEDLILYFSYKLFNKYKIISKTVFRVTRSVNVDIDKKLIGKCDDMKQAMSIMLKKRKSLAPVKLEIKDCKEKNIISNYLMKKLLLSKKQLFILKSPLDYSFLGVLIKMFDRYDYPELFYKRVIPRKPDNITKISMIDEVLNRDILLSYPFDSMALFTKLLDQAAEDRDVVSIKMTLYRVAVNSQIISILKKAADNGKDVLAVVELKARFDEQSNIDWATSLEFSGCKVIYGFENYKIHSKILLITRKQDDKINYISQIGTGNYNEVTAKEYTDLSFMTSDENIGKDILDLFNSICVGAFQETASKLLSSPIIFKKQFLNLISEEIEKSKAGIKTKIIIKCNALCDMDIMLKLIDASNAGVDIKLIVRGICCLLPGIKGYTENIEVISIIGRFLEHSRIFLFGASNNEKIFISSADLMTRNTENRVEVICPIEDEEIKLRIINLLEIYLKDNVLASKLNYKGEYEKICFKSEEKICNSQEDLFNV